MAITFDVLDRFQENKALQTAQIMNNTSRSSKKMVALSPWKLWPFKLEVQKSTYLVLITQVMKLKQNFLKKEQLYVNISYSILTVCLLDFGRVLLQ